MAGVLQFWSVFPSGSYEPRACGTSRLLFGLQPGCFPREVFTPLGKHLARDLMSPVQFFSTSPGLEHEEEVLSFFLVDSVFRVLILLQSF